MRLIPPQYVKPFVKRAKNDRNDAEAICEAAGRPGMRFVPVKSVDQQAQVMVLKVRDDAGRSAHATDQRDARPRCRVRRGRRQGDRQMAPLLAAIEAETAIPPEAKEMLALLGAQIEQLDCRTRRFEVKLTAMHKANAISQRLATMPGIGPIIALTLGDRGRSGGVQIRPPSGSLARFDAEGTFDRRQAAHGRHQPSRQ